MLKALLAGVMTITLAAPVLVAQGAEKAKFYVVREGDKNCTVTDKQPSEWQKIPILGEYDSKKEATKAINAVCGKEPPKKPE